MTIDLLPRDNRVTELATSDFLPREVGPFSRRMSAPFSLNVAQEALQAERARSVARQLTDVAIHRNGAAIEIRLSPEELGQVRLSMNGTETQMTVSILAERSETAELMRRHIDELAREFRELGFDNLSFSFDGYSKHENESASRDSSDNAQFEAVGNGDPSGMEPVLAKLTRIESGIDIRI